MNHWALTGNLTRDPETKPISGGSSVTTGSIASTERYKGKDGWKDRVDYFDFVIWGARGEAFAKYHSKGDLAILEGAAQYESWDDKKSGQKRSKVKLKVTKWEFAARDQGRGGEKSESSAPDVEPEDTPF